MEKEKIKLKRYFYMLRPVLACMWIDQGFGIPPIEFPKLLDRLLPDGALRAEIIALKERKKKADESEMIFPISIISNFITTQMEKFTEATKETQFTKRWEPLDQMFRNTIIQVNGNKIEQDVSAKARKK